MNAKAKQKEKRRLARLAEREQDASRQAATSAAASSAAEPEERYDVQAELDKIWDCLKTEAPTTVSDWRCPRTTPEEWSCHEHWSDYMGNAVRGRIAMLFREGTYEPTRLEMSYCIILICHKIMPQLAQSIFDLRAQRMATRIAKIETGLRWKTVPEGAQQNCAEAHYACRQEPDVRAEQGPLGGAAVAQQADPLQEEMWQQALKKAKQIVAEGADDSNVREYAVKIYRMRKKRYKSKVSKVHARCMAGSE